METTFPVGAVYVYDGTDTPSEKTLGDLWSVLPKRVTPKAEYQPLKVHIVFDNYTDDQVYSVKASKRSDKVMVGGCILGMICKIPKISPPFKNFTALILHTHLTFVTIKRGSNESS